MKLYSIIPLDTEHIDEICKDIKMQYDSKIATMPLFMMVLVPEGNPPVNKAKILCESYKMFKNKLDKMGVPSGVLVQATIGRGGKLSEKPPFTAYTDLNDGMAKEVMCPYDEGFRKYIYDSIKTIASCAPAHIMIDDDFRLMGRPGEGCACHLHMKRFNELAETELTREELYKILVDGSNKKFHDIYVGTQKESLVQTAKIMRSAIDEVDPLIPGSFCCVGSNAEFAYEIAAELAGKDNPVVVRVNNGMYTAPGARGLSSAFQRAAAQIEKLKGKADVILAETDTCPQNRYSTGAMTLHSHFTGSILEGVGGAKHWLTRLHAYEPESGKAYRRILSKYSGFYRSLSEVVPSLKWCGCRIPVKKNAEYIFGKNKRSADGRNGWCACVLERMGIPVYMSSENTGVLCLEGDVFLTDEQLRAAFKNPMLVASDSAEQLIKRGLGKFLGVDVRELQGDNPDTEIIPSPVKNHVAVQYNIKELVASSDKTRELSAVYHSVDGVNAAKLFPAVTEYKNELGGASVVFCGTPNAPYDFKTAFSFLNYTRKCQLIDILKRFDAVPIYYPNDEEVYLRAAETADGNLFAAVFNIGLDPIEKLELVCADEIDEIYIMLPDGSRKPIEFTFTNGRYVLACPCLTLEPVVLFLNKKKS